MIQYFTTSEAMSLLKVSRQTLHNWRKEGKIKASKVGATVRYTEASIKKAMK